MAADDIKALALDAKHDFYELLGLSEGAGETEIRKSYRQTARKYHPDKVGADNIEAREKFHLVQIAHEILSEPTTRELYDHARRAKQQKLERDRAVDGQRRAFKEDLERRERAHDIATGKRKRSDSAERYEQHLEKMRADNRQMMKEYGERLRREAEEAKEPQRERERERQRQAAIDAEALNRQVASDAEEKDRSVKFQLPLTHATKHITTDSVRSRFERFGPIEEVVLLNMKTKKKRPYMAGLIVFKSIAGAHAAVTGFPTMSISHPDDLMMFEKVSRMGNKEPDQVSKAVGVPPHDSEETARASSDQVSKDVGVPPHDSEGTAQASSRPPVPTFKSSPTAKDCERQAEDAEGRRVQARLRWAEERREEERIRQEKRLRECERLREQDRLEEEEAEKERLREQSQLQGEAAGL